MRVLPTCLALSAAAAATLSLAAGSGGAVAATTTPTTGTVSTPADSANPGQAFFHDALIADAKTLAAIRNGLKSGAVIVDPATQYDDLTGDGKQDAVVRVHSTGAAGVTAVYVFSTDGSTSKKLRVVFRSQMLYRALTMVADGHQLQIDQPLYKAGDDVCCPSKLTRRRYRWSAKSLSFTRTSLETIAL
jgi:hypothetical protein